MAHPTRIDLRHESHRINGAGFSLILVSHPDRVEACALPYAGGPVRVVRCADGGGPEALLAAVRVLADVVDGPAADRSLRSA